MNGVRTFHLVRGAAPPTSEQIKFDQARLGESVFAVGGVEVFRGKVDTQGVPVFFVRKPATVPFPESSFLDLPSHCLVVSYQGFFENTWCDGPIVVLQNAVVSHYVPEGYPCILAVGGNVVDSASDLPAPNYYSGVVNSLVTCARELNLRGGKFLFNVTDFDVAEYVVWVLLAKAYPDSGFFPLHEKPYKSWPPIAKRICQHLGWSMYERVPDGVPVDEEVSLLRLSAQPCAVDLVPALNSKSVVIPGKWN